MHAHRTPKAAARKARRDRRQDKAWAARSSTVETVYACICDCDPAACRAALHATERHDTA